MSRQPFAFVTKSGEVVSSKFALKDATSKQIEDRWSESYANHGLKEPLYNPEALAGLAEINVYHYRCCRTKARDTAGLGWSLQSTVENPNQQQEIDLTEWLESLSQSLTATLEKAQYDFETIGYAALEVVRDDYQPDEPVIDLYHVPAHTIRVHMSHNKYAQKRGNRSVWFKAVGYDADIHKLSGEEYPRGSLEPDDRANEMLWWTNYTSRSDYYGLPDILPALGALHGDTARRDYNIEFFSNHGVPAYAVWITGDFDPGEPTTAGGPTPLEEQITKTFRDLSAKPHSTLVMSLPTASEGGQEVKVTFEPLSTDIKEASFRDYRKDNRDEILAVHGVPGYRIAVNETGSLGGNTARESTEIYKRSVIDPRQQLLEDMLNKYIVRDSLEITDWIIKFAELDNVDLESDIKMLTALYNVGAVTPKKIAQYFAEKFGLEVDDVPDVFKFQLETNATKTQPPLDIGKE